MPEISLFYGIRVTMYYDDHNPPHFHVEYAGNKAIIDILNASVMRGALPNKQLKLGPCMVRTPPGRTNAELGAFQAESAAQQN